MVWRLLVVGLLLIFLAVTLGERLIKVILPVLAQEITWLDDAYLVREVILDREGADRVIRLIVSPAKCVVLEGRSYCGHPDALANASTLSGHVLSPLVLFWALILVWPSSSSSEIAGRVMLALPITGCIFAIDVPFVLWAGIWSLHVDAFAPDMFSMLLVWRDFLEAGGRFALALLGALLAIAGCYRASTVFDFGNGRTP